jgi:hypothetical protein
VILYRTSEERSSSFRACSRPERMLDAGDRCVQFGDLADGGRFEGALPRPPQCAQLHFQRFLAELAARRAVVVGSHGLVSLRLVAAASPRLRRREIDEPDHVKRG